MQKTTIPTKKSFRSVGGPISNEVLASLTKGFQEEHPTEQASVFIAKELILASLRQLPNISGLRFVYGINEGADTSTRSIALVPCNDESEGRSIPNFIFLRNGYLTSEGESLSSDACWERFTRYVDRMTLLLPHAKRNEIPRACFFGRDILEEMLSDDNTAGIVYQFGYDPQVNSLPLRYKAALVAVDFNHFYLVPPLDMGMPCPPDTVCNSGSDFFLGDLVKDIDNRPLTEMYHYALPSLTEAFQQAGLTEKDCADVYENQFAACLPLVQEGKRHEAGEVLKAGMEELIGTYLYKS